MPKKAVEKHLTEIFKFIGIDPEISIKEDGEAFRIEVNGDDLSFLIGYRGESLDALQYLITQMVFREMNTWIPMSLDINEYKKRKLEKLDEMIKGFIDRVRFHQKEMRLPPLSPYERRYVHTFVAEYMDVKSESRGEGDERRLYIFPVEKS